MADTNVQRAGAIQVLVGEAAARRREGESNASIRTDLFAEGLPPEVIDHAFAVTESARPRGKW